MGNKSILTEKYYCRIQNSKSWLDWITQSEGLRCHQWRVIFVFHLVEKDKWTGILDVSLVLKKWISLHQFQQRRTFNSTLNLHCTFWIFSLWSATVRKLSGVGRGFNGRGGNWIFLQSKDKVCGVAYTVQELVLTVQF